MANSSLRPTAAASSVPAWRVPQVLMTAAVRSSSLLGHDLMHRLMAERFQLFLLGHLAMYLGAGVVLSLWQYAFLIRSPWLLGIGAICTGQCVVLGVALHLARRGRYQQAITLDCIGNWVTVFLITFVSPNLLPAMVLAALVPDVFAQPYIRWQHGLVFAVITASGVLALAAVARFQHVVHWVGQAPPHWIETAFIVVALPMNAFHVLVIAWNNAAALAVSENMLAERAAEVEASRRRLVTAADEERRRLERDLHDGAQQHLVALAVLIQLARTAGDDDGHQPLLTEASGLLETAIAEIRRLAHGIYPPLLVSGGLAHALPALAAQAQGCVQLSLQGLGRYSASIETALYFCCSEALQNAAKHGGLGISVTITARADDRMLTLTISDTGRGFESATIGTGLTNMTDRLSAIGGNLVIDTAPGRGTRITASLKTPARSAAAC
jgi:signal transduction histidine kinase